MSGLELGRGDRGDGRVQPGVKKDSRGESGLLRTLIASWVGTGNWASSQKPAAPRAGGGVLGEA